MSSARWVRGIYSAYRKQVKDTMVPPGAFTVLPIHRPDLFKAPSPAGIFLWDARDREGFVRARGLAPQDSTRGTIARSLEGEGKP